MSSFAPTLSGRVNRREIALSPHIWAAVSLAFAVFSISCVVIGITVPVFELVPLVLAGFVLGVIALTLWYIPAPVPDSPLTHVVIALTYVATAGAMVAFAPYGYAALPAAIFLGGLAPVWLDKPNHFIAHYAASAVILPLPSLLGITDTATLVATIMLLPPTWVLGLISLRVLQAAEAQSDLFEARSMRDALTGAGNRRLLEDRLTTELAHHRVARRRLSVFALDLNDFKAVNDTLGHAAGDRLLVQAAQRLAEAAGEDGTVVRQGGDEFCVISPGTDAQAATALASELTAALAPIASGVAFSTFPEDGNTPATLVHVADERLIASKEAARSAERGGKPEQKRSLADLAWLAGPDLPIVLAEAPEDAPPVSRETLGSSRELWLTTAVMFLYYAVTGLFITMLVPGMATPGLAAVLLLGGVVGALILLTKPRDLSSVPSHAIVAASYALPAAGMVLADPGALPPIAYTVFAGPLIAVRSTTRLQAAAHTAAAAALFGLIGISGLVSIASSIAILLLIVTTVILSVTCAIVLEAAEAQGRELDQLSSADPLTGLANRRELDRALATALAAASPTLPVSVLALDLNGFKALNDNVGHSAGDQVLVEVAERLQRVVGERGTVARPGGDEFTIVLPQTTAAEAAELGELLRNAIGALEHDGHPIGTGVGAASSPADGTTADMLLRVADRELRDDKYGVREELRAS